MKFLGLANTIMLPFLLLTINKNYERIVFDELSFEWLQLTADNLA